MLELRPAVRLKSAVLGGHNETQRAERKVRGCHFADDESLTSCLDSPSLGDDLIDPLAV